MAKKAKTSKGIGQRASGIGSEPVPSAQCPVPVSPAELAKLSGYTKQQVIKWCAMGLPHGVTGAGKKKRITIDRAAGLAWIKASATGIAGAHGGKRANAGRRSKGNGQRATGNGSDPSASAPQPGVEVSTRSPASTSSPPAAASSPRRLVPPRPLDAASSAPGSAAGQDENPLPGKAWESMTQPEKLAYLQTKTAVEVKQFLDSQKILSEELARAEKERTLISVDEAKEIWTDICSTAANQLDGSRDAITSRLLTELGLPSSAKARIRAILEQEQAKFITTLRGCAYAGGDA